MAKPETIRKLIGRIGSDPTLIDELVSKKPHERKALLVSRGILGAAEEGPTKQEVNAEIRKLLTPAGGQPAPPVAGGERLVEWVGAIATGAAGALALL